LDPTFALAYYYLTRYYESQGEVEKAKINVANAMRNIEKLPKEINVRTRIYDYRIKGDIDNAIAFVKMHFKLHPSNIQLHRELRDLYWENGQLTTAKNETKKIVKALEKEPSISIDDIKMFWLNIYLGKTKKALRVCDRVLKKSPNMDYMLRLKWALLFLTNDLKSADNAYTDWELRIENKYYPLLFENLEYFKKNLSANWDYESISGTYKSEFGDNIVSITNIEEYLVIDLGQLANPMFIDHYFCIPNSDTSFVTDYYDNIFYLEFDERDKVLLFTMDFLDPGAKAFVGRYLKEDSQIPNAR